MNEPLLVAEGVGKRFGGFTALTAVVVLKTGRTLDETAVIAHRRQHMARFKVPKRVILADALPKNPSGELLKRELWKRYEAAAAGKEETESARLEP